VKRAMKGIALAVSLSAGLLAAACGGGGNGITANPAPTPPSGPYSNATLNGTYAFEMSGQDGAGAFARIGSFTANGSGGITAGLEDINSGTLNGETMLAFTSGTYTIQSNGKGTLMLTDSTGTLGFSIVMTSTTNGLITQTDGTATASGNFTTQDTTTFAGLPNNITGPYVFDFAGVDPTGVSESLVGQFSANGGGGIVSGVVDINDGAVASGELGITSATFVKDPTNGATAGRGTATIAVNGNTLNFAFYMVNATRIRFLRTDFPALALGDAVAQTGTIPTDASTLSGSFAFVTAGANPFGSDVRGGRFTLSGGSVSNIQADDNNSSRSGSGNSNPQQIPDGSVSSATYAIDSSGNGRGTLTFTDSKLGTFSFIFYLMSPTQAVIQDNSAGIVADGSMLMQTGGPFSVSGQAGNWALNFAGNSVNGSTGLAGEEDYLGQYTSTSAGSITGGVDFTELSAASVVTNAAITGSLAIQGDGTGRNTYSLTISASPSSTLNFGAYFINANMFFVVGTDTHRTITGTVFRNF
jgi:hypothetical protein